jgi:hypothetical protein
VFCVFVNIINRFMDPHWSAETSNHAGFFPDNRQWFSGLRYNFGTTEREEEWFLTPKRHQIKHLEFVISWFGTWSSH